MIKIFDNWYLNMYAWAEATELIDEEIERLQNEGINETKKD